jgi:hypothetical protein
MAAYDVEFDDYVLLMAAFDVDGSCLCQHVMLMAACDVDDNCLF